MEYVNLKLQVAILVFGICFTVRLYSLYNVIWYRVIILS